MHKIILMFITLVCLLISPAGMRSVAQVSNGIEAPPVRSARLVRRYELRSSMFRVIEYVQVLSGPGSEEWHRENIVIRICSTANLLSSVPSAAINPLELIEHFSDIMGYSDQQILFLRSEDCSSAYPEVLALEIWVADEASDLPPSVERYRNDQLTLSSMGFDPIECINPDYKQSVRKLAEKMRSDPNSYGAIVTYYLKKPVKGLLKRSAASKKMLERSGIPSSRFVVTSKAWHTGDSACIGREPNQPMIFFMSIEQE